MGDSFIPAKDALALAWMQSFYAGLQANPGTYQVSSADLATIQSVVEAFAEAWAVCTHLPTRSPISVANKSVQRAAAEQVCRQYASLIKYNAGISDIDKMAIGIRPVNPHRTSPTIPETSPLLAVIANTPGAQTLRYSDSMTPDSRGKPPGALQIQVFVAVQEQATTLETDGKFYGAFTKNPIGVIFDAADDGKMATYFARWSNRSGQTGPWSLPVSMRIAA
jgi:hypothetical protein